MVPSFKSVSSLALCLFALCATQSIASAEVRTKASSSSIAEGIFGYEDLEEANRCAKAEGECRDGTPFSTIDASTCQDLNGDGRIDAEDAVRAAEDFCARYGSKVRKVLAWIE